MGRNVKEKEERVLRRTNGEGTIQKTNRKTNPYTAKIRIGEYIDKNGKKQIRYKSIGSFETKKEAEEALILYKYSHEEKEECELTFTELYEKWFERYQRGLKSESSARTITCAYAYCSSLYDMKIVNIGAGHIKDVMNDGYIIEEKGKNKGKKKYASKCVQERIKSMCNLMFDYAFERKMIDSNPARAFKISKLLKEIEKDRKIKQIFTQDEISEMWKWVDEVPFLDMILIGIYTGFRPQELAILEVKNIDLIEGKIVGGMKTDNGTNREVPIHPDIFRLVEKRYKQAVELYKSERLFNDPKGQQGIRMTYDKYRHRFEDAIAQLELKGFSPHCTRHTFATYAEKSGMTSGAIKRIMGHSLRGDVTQSVYIHYSFEDLKKEMEKLKIKCELE